MEEGEGERKRIKKEGGGAGGEEGGGEEGNCEGRKRC